MISPEFRPEGSSLLSRIDDEDVWERNLNLLTTKRAFLSNPQRFGEYLQSNLDFQAVGIRENLMPTGKTLVVSAREVESSFGSLVFKVTLRLSRKAGARPTIMYAKAYLPFAKGAPDYMFQESPEIRGQREAQALTELDSLLIEELTIPPLVTYDRGIQLLISLGIDRVEEATTIDPTTDIDGVLSHLAGRILAKIHSHTLTDARTVAKEDAILTDSILGFRGAAAQRIAVSNPTFRQQWLDFVHDTRSRRLCRIHGDLTPRNVLVLDGSKLILFDLDLSARGDPACDIGFFLGHYFLEMIVHPDSREQVQSMAFSLWDAYLEAASSLLKREVAELEARVVNYIAVTLFYRSWFEPAWSLQGPVSRDKINDLAYTIFDKRTLATAFECSSSRTKLP
jgi:thiamine kinase-like enzyme